MRIMTKRLILRTPEKKDWEDIVEGLNDIAVAKNLCGPPYPYKKKDAFDWIKRKIADWRKKEGSREFVIELKSEKKVIGATGFASIDWYAKSAISGSWINKNYWRQGFITEAKIAANDFAFSKLKLRRLQSGAFAENTASNNMSKKFGYRSVGTIRKAKRSKATGKIHDENLYELLKEDWTKNKRKLLNQLRKS